MFPAFQPHPLLPGGHAQTLAGVYLPAASAAYRAVPHRLELDDGDATVLHEDLGAGWTTGAPLLLLVHGLAGCQMVGEIARTDDLINSARQALVLGIVMISARKTKASTLTYRPWKR